MTRVGLVGAGGIAVEHAAAWNALGAEISIYSLAGAEALAAPYGATVAASFDELLATSDVVGVLTPTPHHYEYALAALEAGRNVVCEKPLARTPQQAHALVHAAAGSGAQLYPAHVVRYFPEYVALRAAVDAGHVGRPAVLRFSRAGVFPSWSSWFGEEDQSGGVVMDQMIHDIDIARWVAGEVVAVYATRSPARADGRQSAHVTLTHTSGATSLVTGVWGPPHLTFRTGFHVAGDRGTLRYDSTDAHGVRLDLGPAPEGGQPRPAAAGGESPYLTEVREFAVAFAGGPAPRVSAPDGAVAVQLACAALESIATGEPVEVDTAALAAELTAVAVGGDA
ncbi:oxidoreductase domain protein [Xylanimonas cellulosilytica DSM 15894]|uniref:Oxidoreductase domain protein n=1 Tax=Xylanimonas cellulosilytica (strain DSM 15894 / JCM 12276 / CECT 5975 / KCTC 9989 / LMG 20990 / NBRC 107835 / XIL07) TaxID=446471 RepID=D1BUC9_XYLCX|nr:Gfo/Idh/MocA family oxidoreductase [Xylanimonas cellulosilytica]ACZ31142.1 oxidoreductase domain protein [Xylanimonas cellulosilytica DSM 15894]